MSKKLEQIQSLSRNVNKFFKLLEELDIKDLDSIEKKAKALQKEIEKDTKNLDIKN